MSEQFSALLIDAQCLFLGKKEKKTIHFIGHLTTFDISLFTIPPSISKRERGFKEVEKGEEKEEEYQGGTKI